MQADVRRGVSISFRCLVPDALQARLDLHGGRSNRAWIVVRTVCMVAGGVDDLRLVWQKTLR
jgi:hypothetical protein